MPTNQQRAAEIIGKVMSRWDMDGRPDVSGGIDTCLAQALADAGLITTDLPEPDMTVTGQAPDGTIAPVSVWGHNAEVEAMRDAKTSRVAVTVFGEQVQDPRQIAYYLLAAANHMEKNT